MADLLILAHSGLRAMRFQISPLVASVVAVIKSPEVMICVKSTGCWSFWLGRSRI
jgi:hypothetical protein